MEYTEFADYPTPSGVITEWIPSTAESAWADDDRPLSTNHAAHLAHTRDHDTSWIGTAFYLEGTLDPRAFATTLRRWFARHETFRTTAVAAGDGLRRRVLDTGSLAIDVRRYGRVRSSLDVYRHIEAFLASEVRAHTWPHIVFTTVEHAAHADDRANCDPQTTEGFTVVFGADHAVMDAYTQVVAIVELREIYRAVVAGTEPALPGCGSFVDHSAAESLAAAALTVDHPAVRAWDDFLSADTVAAHSGSDADRLPAFPLPVGPKETDRAGGTTQSSVSLWILPRAQTEAFSAVCKASGSSGSTGILTAIGIALARLSGDRVNRYIMPMHTRTSPEWYLAAGWFVGLIPVHDDLGAAESFTTALTGTATASKAHRALAAHSFGRVAELLEISPRPRFVVSYIDGRTIPGAGEWTARDRALRSPVRSDDEVYLWINRTADGINLSTRFPGNDTASASVHAFIAEFSAVLREVAEHGDAPVIADPVVVRTDGGDRR
ncbi:condensation domain-containing protein [Gordonia sp. ABSL1-1]|uniref:condensation domain-containing protein n=1 Tax=Gordonia sp. ABSL1-1 TaxID=3053923 RepID=UPI0025725E93|nr:condensation domain-containing protein [Gordonia sp. ABSL1-1]MDL9935711.1 condensation domain-containing protein [Gordonia sp. ABSL1-1]